MTIISCSKYALWGHSNHNFKQNQPNLLKLLFNLTFVWPQLTWTLMTHQWRRSLKDALFEPFWVTKETKALDILEHNFWKIMNIHEWNLFKKFQNERITSPSYFPRYRPVFSLWSSVRDNAVMSKVHTFGFWSAIKSISRIDYESTINIMNTPHFW